ncbi:MAG: hypothetical protein QNJ01_10175 [Desulfobacterales bacterium]|nr:hypothetical protein [Desulfobacterales bacterium]
MDMVSIAKESVDLQKRATSNFFFAVTLVQDFAEKGSQYWIDQMNIDAQMKNVVDEWRANYKKGREDSINMINDGFNYMQTYLDELSHQSKESQPQE